MSKSSAKDRLATTSGSRIKPEISENVEVSEKEKSLVTPSLTAELTKMLPIDSNVRWQWEHKKEGKSDWRDYKDADNAHMERAFQSGVVHVRINAGKDSDTKKLKEIFLADMVQYDALTGNVRNIRRCGPDSIWAKIRRYVLGELKTLANGSARHKSFLKRRKEIIRASTGATKQAKVARSLRCEKIVASGAFMLAQMSAILLNTVVIGLDTEFNGDGASNEAQLVFAVIDNMFCLFFTAEIILRFGAMKKQPTCCKALAKIVKHRWFAFDFFLVFIMVIETWLMPLCFFLAKTDNQEQDLSQLTLLRLLRLLRLSRIGRIARLLTVFPEVFIMVKSILAATRAVMCTFGLLFLITYIFAIIFKSRAEGSEIEHMFSSLPGSMWQLLLNGALMDNLGDCIDEIYQEDWALAFVFMFFVFLSNFTVLNMLIGVICEVANDVSLKERERAQSKALTSDFKDILVCFDLDGDGSISIEEFGQLLNNPDVREMLERHEIDYNMLLTLKNTLFVDKEATAAAKQEMNKMDVESLDQRKIPIKFRSISFSDMIDILLRFRGGDGNQATVLDVVTLDEAITSQFENLEKFGHHDRRLHREKQIAQLAEMREQMSEITSRQHEMLQDIKAIKAGRAAGFPTTTKEFASSGEDAGGGDLLPGVAVRLNDLKVSKDFNGKVGLMQLQRNNKGHILVKLQDNGQELLIPPQNLQPVTPTSSTSSSVDLHAAVEAQGQALQTLSSQIGASEERFKQLETAIDARMQAMTAAMTESMKAATDMILQRLPLCSGEARELD